MNRISWKVVSEIRIRLNHEVLEAAAWIKGLAAAANLGDGSTESKRTFYLVSLMLFISLVFISPDKIPQTLAIAQVDSEALNKVQEIVKKAVPFMS